LKNDELQQAEPHAEDPITLPVPEVEAPRADEAVEAPLIPPRAPDPPHMFEELAERGMTLLSDNGDLSAALEALERANAIRSDDPDVSYALGVIYGQRALFELGRTVRALLTDGTSTESLLAKSIFCYQRAIELDPRRAEPWRNLATLYAIRGDRELAIESLKRSLQIAPDQPEIRERLEELGAF
jgi:tetratricopeptide (TPR) repeat protein